jgi:glycerate kinase
MVTSTYGTGELIKHAYDQGCRKVLLGIGGSATNDGAASIWVACLLFFMEPAIL